MIRFFFGDGPAREFVTWAWRVFAFCAVTLLLGGLLDLLGVIA